MKEQYQTQQQEQGEGTPRERGEDAREQGGQPQKEGARGSRERVPAIAGSKTKSYSV